MSETEIRQNEERLRDRGFAEMLNSVNAGLVSGRFVGVAGQFTSVNQYFCNILGLTEDEVLGRKESGDLNDSRTVPGLLEAIHPDDIEDVKKYFGSLCVGNGSEGEAVFRIKTVNVPAGQYFNCMSRTILQDDGSYVVYSVYTDATGLQEQKAEFNRVIQELLVTNPHSRCAYHLNLTRNLCLDCHGADEYIRHIFDAETAEEMLQRAAFLALDADIREMFLTEYTPAKLVERYKKGDTKFSVTYRRKTVNSKYLWVETFYQLMKNPTTGDIEAIAYTVDEDWKMKEETLFTQLSEEEFFGYGIVDVETHHYEHFYLKDTEVRNPVFEGTIEDNVDILKQRIETPGEADDFEFHTSVGYITDRLKEASEYRYSFTMDHRRMEITYRYLDSTHDYISFMIKDITETVAMQEETMSLLRSALEAANAANSAKTEFLSRMSHDIRTPMNAIIGFSTLLRDNPDDAEKVHDNAVKILASSNHLLGLINDVLDMSKIESGKVELSEQSFNLSDTIEVVDEIMRPQMNVRGQSFEVRVEHIGHNRYMADSQRLQQILLNVLSNASKYTGEDGSISMLVEGEPDRTGLYENVTFTVSDNGRGMSEEYVKILFEPFSREKLDYQDAAQGTGLGMAITKNLVSLMGGTISVVSRLGKGSTFKIAIPLMISNTESDDKRVEVTGASDGDISGMRILAAEDNELNKEILIELLSDCEVDVCSNGRELVDRYIKCPCGAYDIILTDIQMPVMDGMEAARAIRAVADDANIIQTKREEATRIPIIAMTANAFTDDIQNALDAGMNAHVAKPIDIENLRRTLYGFYVS